MPRVLNWHAMTQAERRNSAAVYVGRGSPWGNPFHIGQHGDRDAVCDAYERFVLPGLDIAPLRGKDLICYCAPARCHADALLREANKESAP